MPRVLFCTKKRHSYWGQPPGTTASSGLGNSVSFIVEMLIGLGITARAVELVDNNGIDAAVSAFRPTHVIIEALWVVPQKFDVLKKLHPRVQWCVRIHSNLPFLASEGVAVGWIAGYLRRGVEVLCNSPVAVADVRAMAVDTGSAEMLVQYAPNYYPPPPGAQKASGAPVVAGQMNVGCYGAVRPMKNHLTQAVGAVAAANAAGTSLRFHINAGRVEGEAASVVANLRALFAASARGGHRLVEEPWLDHDAFLAALRSVDVVTQVSFTETFNIVAADGVYAGVPVVVSPAVGWLGAYAQADPSDARTIAAAIGAAYCGDQRRLARQASDLRVAAQAAEDAWQARLL